MSHRSACTLSRVVVTSCVCVTSGVSHAAVGLLSRIWREREPAFHSSEVASAPPGSGHHLCLWAPSLGLGAVQATDCRQPEASPGAQRPWLVLRELLFSLLDDAADRARDVGPRAGPQLLAAPHPLTGWALASGQAREGSPRGVTGAVPLCFPPQYDEHVISPKEFVHLAGKSTLKDWKRAIRMNGIMLRWVLARGRRPPGSC